MGQRTQKPINEIRIELLDFCRDHEMMLAENDEVSLEGAKGVPAVGFIAGSGWVKYAPTYGRNSIPIRELEDKLMIPDDTVPDVFWRQELFAVQVFNDNRDAALRQLHAWMLLLQVRGGVVLTEYLTGQTGVMAVAVGLVGYCLISVRLWHAIKARIQAGQELHPAIRKEQFLKGVVNETVM